MALVCCFGQQHTNEGHKGQTNMHTRYKDMGTTNERIGAFKRLIGPDVPDIFKGKWESADGEVFDEAPTALQQLVGDISHKQLAGALVGQMLHEHDTTGRRFYYGPHNTTLKGRTDKQEPLPGLYEAWDRFKGPLWDKEFLYLLSQVKGNFDADTFRRDFAESLVSTLYERNRIAPKRDRLAEVVDELLADPPTATKATRTAPKANNAPHRAARVNVLHE